MLKKSLTEDAQEVFRAIALIELGARMQVLESELTLSRDRMIRLYREVKGVSPPKGMLPFSADWYMTWLANIHASLFYNTYTFLKNEAGCSHLDALTKGIGCISSTAIIVAPRRYSTLRGPGLLCASSTRACCR